MRLIVFNTGNIRHFHSCLLNVNMRLGCFHNFNYRLHRLFIIIVVIECMVITLFSLYIYIYMIEHGWSKSDFVLWEAD